MSDDHTHPCTAHCGRPADGYYLCRGCTDELASHLATVGALADELATTAARLARMGQPIAVATSGPAPLPFAPHASDAADVMRNTLTTWARTLADHMGHRLDADSDAAVAAWLRARLHTIRTHPAAGDLADEIGHAIAHGWRAVDRPPGRVYVGPCGADGCTLDLYARADPERPGALDPRHDLIRCECGAQWGAAARRSWLFDQLHDSLATAREIASGVGTIAGRSLNEKTIRTWHRRGRLSERGRDSNGIPLHRIGDVVALATHSATRNVPSGRTRQAHG